ncbi:MAG: tRNA-dihydrouridine synthase family protein [Desulfobacteraceae bacterium]|nr:tRNA-dihydrouridine synthase family protein [Desulfobacteraceae bacterium]
MAPLRGLTGAIFRNTYAEFFDGIDWAVTPFLTTIAGTRLKASQLKEVLPENNRLMPIVPQILSKTADRFITLSKALFDLGHGTVNWNLGCPFAKVAKKMRGSGLLPHPDLIDAFLEAVFKKIPNQLSIKTRLGRRQPDEFFKLIPVFNRYPIKEIIIHPRTGEQMYTGRVDLDVFEQCLASLRADVIYNGDVNEVRDFKALQARFPALSTWMIGRGVLANPYLPVMIKGRGAPGGIDCLDRFRRFHDTLFERYAAVRHGPVHLADSMKGYWGYFAGAFCDGAHLLKQIRKVHGAAQYQEVVQRFFDGADPECCFTF